MITEEEISANADGLIALGVKAWLRQKKKKVVFSEAAQREVVDKEERKRIDDKTKT